MHRVIRSAGMGRVSSSEDSPERVLSDGDFEAYLEEVRRDVELHMESLVPQDTDLRDSLYAPMLDYPKRRAKALRPTLCHAMCCGLGGRRTAVLPSATVLELFHNAFLIHDDVEDGSLLRRGQDTLHRKHGTPIAINVGDAMFAMALAPLLDNMKLVGLGPALRILSLVFEMARESTEGQAMELGWIRRKVWALADADYLEMVRKKTSVYTFVTPLLIGASAAGSSDRVHGQLQRLGEHLGAAFQIHDDLLNLDDDVARYGKEAYGDLWEGKRTLPVLHALRTLSSPDAVRARTILDRPRTDAAVTPTLREHIEATLRSHVGSGALPTSVAETLRRDLLGTEGASREDARDIEWLRDAIEQTGGIEHATLVASEHHDAAHEVLAETRDWLPPSIHRAFLTTLVDYAVERRR